MTGWYIAAGVLALLVLLLFCPVRFLVRADNSGTQLKAKYLFLRFRLYPRPEKPEKKKRAPEAPDREKEKTEQPSSGIFGLLETVSDVLPPLLARAGRIAKHIVISRCEVRAKVCGEDAAQTGIRCGRANAVIYNLYMLASSYMTVKDFRSDISPDFEGSEEKYRVAATIRIRPVFILHHGILFLLTGGGALIPRKKINKKGSEKSYGTSA